MKNESDAKTLQETAEKLLMQALRARRNGRHADARRDLLEAMKLCLKAGAQLTLAQTHAMLGQIERDEKQIDSALSHYEEAQKIFREIGDADRVAHSVRHVGDIQRSCGRLELAEPCYKEALEIYRNSAQTRPLDLANAIRGLALLKGEKNAAHEAKLLWEEARDLYESVNVPEGVAECIQRIADLGLQPN